MPLSRSDITTIAKQHAKNSACQDGNCVADTLQGEVCSVIQFLLAKGLTSQIYTIWWCTMMSVCARLKYTTGLHSSNLHDVDCPGQADKAVTPANIHMY